MHHLKIVSVSAALICALFTSVLTSAQHCEKEFRGKLDGILHVDPEELSVDQWSLVEVDAARVPHHVTNSDRIFEGKFILGTKPFLLLKTLLIEHSDHQRDIYVDVNRDDKFDETEQYTFKTITSPRYESETRLNVPLSGHYLRFPMLVRLLRPDAANPFATAESITVLYTSRPFVEGTVRLPSRPSLLVRYTFDVSKDQVNLHDALQYVDTDGDGKIDLLEEREVPDDNRKLVFHVDELFLATTAVDLDHQDFVLQSVPETDYKRIELRKGSVLPEFEFTDFEGNHRQLSDVKGKYRLIEFWASWCAPCIADLKTKKSIYERFHAQGFEILGMNGDQEIDKPKELTTKLGATWPQARLDSIRELVKERFRINAWPTSVLVDESGKIVATGAEASVDLENTLNRLLPARQTPSSDQHSTPSSQASNNQDLPKPPNIPDANPELLQLVIQDQWDRGMDMFGGREIKPPEMHGRTVTARDEERQAAVRKLLADGKVKSGSDFWFSALILQHSTKPEGVMLAHILAAAAAANGNSNGKWLAAASLDRFLWDTNQPQVFGTQFKKDSAGKWSMEPYARGTLSDSERAVWCVVPLVQQEKILNDFQDGKPLAPTSIFECK